MGLWVCGFGVMDLGKRFEMGGGSGRVQGLGFNGLGLRVRTLG